MHVSLLITGIIIPDHVRHCPVLAPPVALFRLRGPVGARETAARAGGDLPLRPLRASRRAARAAVRRPAAPARAAPVRCADLPDPPSRAGGDQGRAAGQGLAERVRRGGQRRARRDEGAAGRRRHQGAFAHPHSPAGGLPLRRRARAGGSSVAGGGPACRNGARAGSRWGRVPRLAPVRERHRPPGPRLGGAGVDVAGHQGDRRAAAHPRRLGAGAADRTGVGAVQRCAASARHGAAARAGRRARGVGHDPPGGSRLCCRHRDPDAAGHAVATRRRQRAAAPGTARGARTGRTAVARRSRAGLGELRLRRSAGRAGADARDAGGRGAEVARGREPVQGDPRHRAGQPRGAARIPAGAGRDRRFRNRVAGQAAAASRRTDRRRAAVRRRAPRDRHRLSQPVGVRTRQAASREGAGRRRGRHPGPDGEHADPARRGRRGPAGLRCRTGLAGAPAGPGRHGLPRDPDRARHPAGHDGRARRRLRALARAVGRRGPPQPREPAEPLVRQRLRHPRARQRQARHAEGGRPARRRGSRPRGC